VNQAAESILGCTSEALIGQPFVDAAPKELRELYGQVLGRVLGGESLHDYEMVCHHSAGARRVLRIKARPRLDADGQIVGIMGTAADVTYLLQAQREIRSNSELFASILSRLPLFFFRVDGEGRFTDIRGAGLRRLHLGEQGLYGRSVYELFPTKERRVKAALGGSTTLFEAHGDHEGEGWSFTVSMFFDNARGSGAVGLAMDVTERKVAETKLVGLVRENRALARRLIEVQEDERTALSRELHDELGQSITAVKSLATAIARVKPGQEQRVPELGNSIVELAAHLYEVVKHIMHRLRPDIIDSMGIEEALRSCVQNSRLEMMGVGVSLELDGDLTGLSELVQVTIYRIVQECLTNIAKYAMASNVAVTVRRAQLPVRERRGLLRGFSGGETSQSMTVPMFRDTLVIDISDDGVGMDLRATLDEPSPASAGLGLQGIRERVTALGGEFEVYSETGRGLQLTVTIDLETHEAKLARDAEASGDAIPPKEVRIR
jgi:PAS domain S-box-containing protein